MPKIIGKFLIINLNDNIQVEIMHELSKHNYYIGSLVENKKTLTERERLRLEY